ncbi:FtsH protease activity modulator HflK [Kangiella profundi]|uniref:Protein HflK n=1 Tax=Kangiella profundi TaxID=1561924 RepID=A0A2K9AZN7_9GAMM|nr:FtsH protease activity modulator HflK [Kangiella profundi]AUD78138.1 FtsH protease activity modulator HflK [Kangiella profundi]GGF05394.1 protease modulator HflK [Kangiella profundi]
MAWNEPGNNNDQDPWGKKRPNNNNDLDKLLKQASEKFGGIFGGGKGNGKGSSGGNASFIIGLLVLVAIYLFKSAYTVDEKQNAIVLTLGKHTRTDTAGLHFAFPPIQQVYLIDVESIKDVEVEGLMLTKDDNVATVKVKVQYRVNDPLDYKFNVVDPVETLKHATEAALRQVIGHTLLQDARTDKKEDVRKNVENELKSILKPYNAGIEIFRLNLIGNVDVPPSVKPAFDDAIKAEEDQRAYLEQGQAYRSKQIPLAEGQAQQLIQQANAYRARVVEKAAGEVARFEKLLPEYTAAPVVTRQRLYIETIESVLSKTSKVMLDVEGGNNMTYIPLDSIMKRSKTSNTDNSNQKQQ